MIPVENSFPASTQTIRDAVREESSCRLAHRFLNTLVYLGAKERAEASRRMERAAKEGAMSQVALALQGLNQRLIQLKVALEPQRRKWSPT